MKTGMEGPTGLGGWLILPAISLFVLPIRLAVNLSKDLLPIFQNGAWELLTTPGTDAYHYLWAPVLVFETAGNALFILFDIFLIFLFFKKSQRFPTLFIIFLALSLLFFVFDSFFAGFIPAVAANKNLRLIGEFVSKVISAAIWIFYFLYSKRVENTFGDRAGR